MLIATKNFKCVIKRSNQSILKEISPECSLEGLMLKLKSATWCEELIHLKRPWCWERLKAGGEGDDRRWDGWMASLTKWTWVWVNSGNCWWTRKLGMLQSMGSQGVGYDWTDWTYLPMENTQGEGRELLLFHLLSHFKFTWSQGASTLGKLSSIHSTLVVPLASRSHESRMNNGNYTSQ